MNKWIISKWLVRMIFGFLAVIACDFSFAENKSSGKYNPHLCSGQFLDENCTLGEIKLTGPREDDDATKEFIKKHYNKSENLENQNVVYIEGLKRDIISKIPFSVIPEQSVIVSVRILTKSDGVLKKVIPAGYSGFLELDRAVMKAARKVKYFVGVPQDLLKKMRTTGLVIDFAIMGKTKPQSEEK